jgi:hypothetical protein
MTISGIKGFNPVLIDNNKPQPKVDQANSLNDKVLDLSDRKNIVNELLNQDLNSIEAVKIGDQFVTLKPEEVKKLVETLKKELLENNSLNDNFKMVSFSQKTGIISVENTDFTKQNASATMSKRAEMRLNIKDDSDIYKAVGRDNNLVETKYKNSPSVAGKILLQDMALLERKGMLSEDDKKVYTEIMGKYVENYQNQKKTGKTEFISPDDVARLHEITSKVASGKSGLGPVNLDQGAISKVGTAAGGSVSDQYSTVVKNIPAAMNSSYAAMHDAVIATKEVGKGDGVEGGRSFPRMQKAINELGNQFHLINDQLMPAVAAQAKDLSSRMDDRMLEIAKTDPKYKDLKTADDVRIAMVNDPKLSAKIESDPKYSALKTEHSQVMATYNDLGSQAMAVADAKVQTLKEYQSVNTVFNQEQTRTGKAQVVTAKLALGAQKLEGMEAKLNQISESNLPPAEKQKQVDAIKADIKALRDDMVKSMNELIDTYKQNGNPNPTALKLLESQRDTIAKFDADPAKIKEAIATFEGARTGFISALEKSVPVFISEKEVKTLKSLDKGVADFVNGKVSADSRIIMTNDMIQVQIDEAKHEKDDATTKGLHELESMESTQEGGGHGKGEHHEISTFGLSYGSHARISLELGAGIGVGIGKAIDAKVALSVEAALTVEKTFTQSERPYQVHVDLSMKLTGDLTIAHVFEAHGEIKAGLAAGLAFENLGQAKAFGGQLAKVIALSSALGEIQDLDTLEKMKAELEKEMDKLSEMVKEHGYTGTSIEVKGDVKSELPGAEVGLKGGWRREVNTFGDGKKVQEDHYKGKVEVGHFGVSVVVDKSKVLNPKEGEKSEDWSRIVGSVAIPAELFEHALHHGGFKHLPKGVLEEIVKQFNKLNPGMAQLSTGVLLSYLDNALEAAKKGNGIGLARLSKSAKGEAEVTIGIEMVTEGPKKYMAVELGVEASKKYKADVPIGGGVGFIRTGVEAELEVGLAIKVWENHPEESGTENIYEHAG